MQTESSASITLFPIKDRTGNVHSQSNGSTAKPIRLESEINWNDIESVDRIKDSVTKLLSKSALSEDDLYSMCSSSSSALQLMNHLRFDQLSHICDVRIDPFGRRTYHAKQKPTKKDINIEIPKQSDKLGAKPKRLDRELEKETALVISALTETEISLLRATVIFDLAQDDDDIDDERASIYACINGILSKSYSKSAAPKHLKPKQTLQVASQSIEIKPPKHTSQYIQIKPMQRERSVEIDPPKLEEIQQEHDKTVTGLRGIIERKNAQIQEMIALNVEQTELIRSLSGEEVVAIDEDDDDDEDMDDINECGQIVQDLTRKISNFKADYNKMKVDAIGEADRNNLVDSPFITRLNKYAEVIKSMSVCVKHFGGEVGAIQTYIEKKYLPNVEEYKQWTLDDIMIWIKSLENGRFNQHYDKLLFGFKESEINDGDGELLPDLGIADLSVTPFNITQFKDKRDLVKYFKTLRVA